MDHPRSCGDQRMERLEMPPFANVERLLERVPSRTLRTFIATATFAWLYPQADPLPMIDHYLESDDILSRFRLHFLERFTELAGKTSLTFKLSSTEESDADNLLRVEVICGGVGPMVMAFRATNESIAQLVGALCYHSLIEVSYIKDGFVARPTYPVSADQSVLASTTTA